MDRSITAEKVKLEQSEKREKHRNILFTKFKENLFWKVKGNR